jgi:hypothetical protein
VDERLAGARAGWQLAGGGHLQALDDGLAMAGRGVRGGEERQGEERGEDGGVAGRTGHPSAREIRGVRECIDRRTVFPAPLRPTMRVRGLGNMMAWSLSGLKLRMPFMSILSTEHMTASRRGFQTQSRKRGVPTRGERDLRDEGGSRCGRARRPAARYGRANEARA